MSLYSDWIDAKEIERRAVERRREIEDEITGLMNLPETFEGTESFEADGFKVKIVGRLNRKVDGDKLQEIAIENGLQNFLSTLFRWKPEINATIWKSTDSKVTDILAGAVVTTPGRPSYTIEEK